MIREEYFRRLVDAAHVELYLSGSDGARIYWPWRMEPPKEASRSYRNACEKYVIDSDPLRPSVTTEDVFNAGVQYGAEIVSLVDYVPFDVYERELDPEQDEQDWKAYQKLKNEYGSGFSATIDSVKQGLRDYQDHPFDGTLLIPLQAPYAECYRGIGEPRGHWIGIGGLKDASDMPRINAAREVREVAPGEHIHGFGWGPRPELARQIRRNPSLLDSLDYSTPVQSAPYEDSTSGDERMSVTAAFAGYRLVRDLRELTSHPAEPTSEDLRGEGQSGMEVFADAD